MIVCSYAAAAQARAAHEAHDFELYGLAAYGYSSKVDLNASHFYQLNVGMGALYQAVGPVYIGVEAGFAMITATMVQSTGWFMSGSETVWSSNGFGFQLTPLVHLRSSDVKPWVFDLGVGYALRFVNIPVDNVDALQFGINGSGDAGNALVPGHRYVPGRARWWSWGWNPTIASLYKMT